MVFVVSILNGDKEWMELFRVGDFLWLELVASWLQMRGDSPNFGVPTI